MQHFAEGLLWRSATAESAECGLHWDDKADHGL